MFSRSGLSFTRTSAAALLLARLDERAADVAVLHEAVAVRDARRARVALRGGHTRLGNRHHHVGRARRLARELLAHALADARARSGRTAACRDARCRRTRRCRASARLRRSGSSARRSRRSRPARRARRRARSARRRCRARRVSLASTQPPSVRPSTSGRNPLRSRTPNRCASSISTSENAPASRGSTCCSAMLEVAAVGAAARRRTRGRAARRSARCRT